MNINGIKVVESLQATEVTATPVKAHRKSKGSDSYHKRIQKKWSKRFGFMHKPCIFQLPDAFIVHPSFMPRLRALESNRQTP